ncbi:adenylate/guanylate cyclase domain-containing protein, partial [Elusimicrobiota bacterium]
TGVNKVEIVVIPKPDTVYTAYQCANTLGYFEAISKIHSGRYPKVDHPECVIKQGNCCRYILEWEDLPYLVWKKLRNYFILLTLMLAAGLFFIISFQQWAGVILLILSVTMILSYYSEYKEKRALLKKIAVQGDAARRLLDEINTRYKDIILIKEMGQATSVFTDVDEFLVKILDSMGKFLDFKRCGVWLADDYTGILHYKAGFGFDKSIDRFLRTSAIHTRGDDKETLHSIVFTEKTNMLINDMVEIAKRPEKEINLLKQIKSQSFVIVPLIFENKAFGIILADNPRHGRVLNQTDMSMILGIASQIAIGINNTYSYRALQRSREVEVNLRKLFEKYVPAPVIKKYLDTKDRDLFRGEVIYISILFLDIRNFTTGAEKMSARGVVSFLNDFFEKCSMIISEEGGHINKYTGDGFLAIFGAPEYYEDHTMRIFKAASRIESVAGMFSLAGDPVSVGIGIHTGRALVGNIGSNSKIEYTAIGDVVNTAERVQEFSKVFEEYPIILSGDTWMKLKDHSSFSSIVNLGMHKIRGKKNKMELYGYKP